MKKLALSLAAFGIASTSVLAGTLQLDSVGQKLEYKHENRQPGGDYSLSTDVKLKYEDWDFGVKATKEGKYNQTSAKENSRRVTSSEAKVNLSVGKKVTPELKAKYEYEGTSSENNNTASLEYNRGIYSSELEAEYNTSNKREDDNWKLKYKPIGISKDGFSTDVTVNYEKYRNKPVKDKLNVKYKPFEINYDGLSSELTVEYNKYKNKPVDNTWKFKYKPIGVSYEGVSADLVLEYEKYKKENALKYESNGKLALKFPVYSEGDFSLKGNLDVKLFDKKAYRETTAYHVYRDFGQVTAKLSANYKVDENLSLNASVEYQFRNFKYYNVEKDPSDRSKHVAKSGNKNKQVVTLGWKYKL